MQPARDENQNVGDASKQRATIADGCQLQLGNGVLHEPQPEDDSPSSSSCSLDGSDSEGDSVAPGRRQPLPDGGWGWVVVLASFIISMVADGISFSFGLLYIEFLGEFGESKSKTSWIGSLFMAVPLLSGPVMSALVDRFGCRSMTIMGGIISAIGFAISTRVYSIEVMYLTFGVLAGLGLGLCYVTAIVSIAYWFDRRRSLAVGLGACGTGIGTFIYAPLTLYLIEEYGWRGTTLILAGTFLQMCVCGTLMREPDWRMQSTSRAGSRSLAGRPPSVSTVSCVPDVAELRELLRSGKNHEYILTALATSAAPDVNLSSDAGVHARSVVNIPTFVRQNERVPLEVLETLVANKRLCHVILENYPSLLSCRSVSDRGFDKLCEDSTSAVVSPVTVSMRVKRSEPPTNVNSPLPDAVLATSGAGSPNAQPARRKRQSSVPACANYLRDIRLHKHSVVYRGAMLNIHKYHLRASSCPNIYRNSMTTLAHENQEKWYADTLQLLRGMVDFSMFLELHFLLMSVSTVLLYTWFIVPYFYLAELLTRVGYSEADASTMLSVIGVTNTIGMVALGWAGDQPWMPVTKAYAWCLALCGVSIIVIILFTTYYPVLFISCACFGLTFAGNYSFTPAILVELVPLERFTTAYGLILMCQGIGNLLGPPIAGWLFDVTGTWYMSFLQAGVWIVIAGILLIAIPCTTNRKVFGSGPIENEKCLA